MNDRGGKNLITTESQNHGEDMTASLRWGILGAGDVCEVKSGPAFQKATGSELVAVMRRNAERAQDYAKRHGVPRWYDDAQALVDDPEVDAVYVATPPSSHHEYTLLAARAGKPVYVEKPMAMNSAECKEMIAACQKAGVPLFVAFYRRALETLPHDRDIAEALERLAELCADDPQRIGLSATVQPLDEVARFLGGRRRVGVVDASARPSLDLAVTVPVPDMERPVSPERPPRT